jgi:hypothetical protein
MATITIKSTKDASTLAGGASGTILTSDWNGFDQHHPVGNFASGAYRVRSLIYFPIDFTGWSSVTSASLVLTTSTTHNSWGTSTKSLNVARSLVAWTEDAGAENNWTQWVNNTYNNYGHHNTAGTDYDISDMTTVSVSGTRPSTVTIDVTAQVNSWLGGANNNGFILYMGNETADSHYAEFYAREYGTSSARPTLNITYTTNTAPTAPTLNSPLSASRQDGGVTFNFTQNDADTSDYVTGYQVDVSSVSDFSTIAFTDTASVSRQSSTVSAYYSGANGLTPLSTYYWRVKTKDSAGEWSPYSTNVATNTFKINLAPSVPSGLGPTGGAVVTTLTPTFTGTTSDTNTGDRVASVRVRLYLTNGTSVWDSSDVTVAANGAFSVPCGVTLTAATNYYWTVSAKDTFGYSSAVSSNASFSTFAGGVTLATPNDDTSTGWIKTLTPTFTFTALSNISQYTLKIYDTGGALFTTVGPTSPTAATSISYVYASTALQWNSRYFWTITATVNGQALAESSQAMFHTNSKPVALALSPSDGAAVGSLDPTFTIQFSDTDLSYGLPDSPTSLEVEVSRVSDSVIMYTLSKLTGLDVTSNGLNKANSTVTAGAGGSTLTLDVQYRFRSRYKDNAGASANNTGDWSTYRVFKPTTPPTVASVAAITADLTSGVVNKPNPTVQYSYTGSASKAQAQRRIVAKHGSTGVVLYDSGFVVSTAASGSTPTGAIPTGYLVQGNPLKFEVTARDSELVDSSIVSSTTYNTSWSVPADIDGVSATSENGSVIVRWDAVVNALFSKYEVYRRNYGTTEWVSLGYISDISTTSYIDYESGIGERYDYRVTQYSDVGAGNLLESNPLTAIVTTSSSNEDNWFIVPENNYGLSVELYAQSENRTNPFQEEVFEPFGRTRKVVVRTARYGTEGSFEAFIPADEVASKLEKLTDILSLNVPVWLKDPYGSVLSVYLGAPEYSYQPVGHLVATINYIEVD